MVANTGKITTLAAAPTVGMIDGIDTLHTGLIQALEVFSKGRMCIKHDGFTLSDAGSYTRYSLVNPRYIYDGEFKFSTPTFGGSQTK